MSTPATLATTTPASGSHSNFQSIFHASLREYEKQTRKDLISHPLAARLNSCDSPAAILAVLQDQVQEFEQSRSVDERLTKWLDPTVNVLYAFSTTLGEGVGLVFSPAKIIFAGAGVLLLAAKDVGESQGALADVFERVENFFKRLETYTEVTPTAAMTDIIVKIMVEVLGILAISTKEIRQGRTKKYLKRLAGRTELEDALKRLDKLTQEEARMAAAQLLEIAHNVENKITQVIDDGKEARAMAKEARAMVKEGRATTKDVKAILQQATSSVDSVKRTQMRQELRKWVSPPDPSTNHNIACDASHKQTAEWFLEGNKIKEWKSTGSLLWIHGKPGAGKSILCSSIIQDAFVLRDAGLASIAYFYFDFRDTDKQSRHDLLLSLVSQLSARSDPCCEILFRLYVAHDNGEHRPSDGVLVRCLKEMLTVLVQSPTYLIVDALDECPNTSGIPSARARAIELVKELLGLRLPNLRVCITSRPEIDIKASLGPLASHSVSLHDEIGQKQDIADFIKSVVYSDSDTMMSRWREDEKNLVIETLSERADGMFRWVFCQLEALQDCLPASVRRTLEELPESLDETYERILKEIKRPSMHHAHRLLQCLTVAIRPLRVEELAELLAYDFDATRTEGGIPKVNPNWRWNDHERAVLSTCSSLIAVVGVDGSQVVQFSHFSVKEFLTSDRLATSGGDASHYHISLGLAHTLLAQACLGTLLSLDDEDGESNSADRDGNSFPLASYAAQHWVAHALVDKVLPRVQGGMQRLFDPTKPHFAAWVQLYNVEDQIWRSDPIMERMAMPLYYAALCGFRGLVEHHLIKYPEHVNALGGGRGAALHAASARNHVEVAQLLLERGGDVDVRGKWVRSPLQFAAIEGHVEMGRFLLDHGADVDSRQHDLWTPLHQAMRNGYVDVSQMLLEHKADINSRTDSGEFPLHWASKYLYGQGDYPGVVRLLLEHGADVDVKDNEDATPLHAASSRGPGETEVVRLLLGHGANAHAEDKWGRTPLQVALANGKNAIAQMLTEHEKTVSNGVTSCPLNHCASLRRASPPSLRALTPAADRLCPSFAIHVAVPNAPKDHLDAADRTRFLIFSDRLGCLIARCGADNLPAVRRAKALSGLTFRLLGSTSGAPRPIATEAMTPLGTRSEAYSLVVPANGSAASLCPNALFSRPAKASLVIPGFTDIAQKGTSGASAVYTRERREHRILRWHESVFSLRLSRPDISKAHPEHIACFKATSWATYANLAPVGQLRLASPATVNFTIGLLNAVAKLFM
ncbi:hypothetical protein EDB89DRAFT_2076339 [Lactarius sanguifluus]|nr:hypothetical protein EDB89DRAFT_2076339 [Lactarius sanguifluus]